MKSVEHVDNYKTILKSVKILNEKKEQAENLGVKLIIKQQLLPLILAVDA